jgi:hypothetical protein
MFADDEKNEMEEQEQDAEQPEEESFDAEMTMLDSVPAVEAAPDEEGEPPAPKKAKPAKAEEAAEQADDAWTTVASSPAKKAAEPKAQKKEKPAAQPSKAEFAPTTPLEAVSAAESGGESKVPLGDFLSNLGIKDQTWQIVVLVAAGLILLCCLCSCVGIVASMALGGFNY